MARKPSRMILAKKAYRFRTRRSTRSRLRVVGELQHYAFRTIKGTGIRSLGDARAERAQIFNISFPLLGFSH